MRNPFKNRRYPALIAIGLMCALSATAAVPHVLCPIQTCARPPIHDQTLCGGFAGRVYDMCGHPIMGALVTIERGKAIKKTVATDADGAFSFIHVAPADDYRLKVEHRDYESVAYGRLPIFPGYVSRASFTMRFPRHPLVDMSYQLNSDLCPDSLATQSKKGGKTTYKGALVGRVVGRCGRPIKNVEVRMYTHLDGSFSEDGTTKMADPTGGTFAFCSLAPSDNWTLDINPMDGDYSGWHIFVEIRPGQVTRVLMALPFAVSPYVVPCDARRNASPVSFQALGAFAGPCNTTMDTVHVERNSPRILVTPEPVPSGK